MTAIEQYVQGGGGKGARVVLYQLDLTMFDEGTLYLAPGTVGTGAVEFGGETYVPHPIKAEGFEQAMDGPNPRPTLTVSNLRNSFTALVEQHDDLQGGILTRLRTFERYLDTGAEPDGTATLTPDVYLLARKSRHTRKEIAWQLTALTDVEGVELPGRKVVRDYCPLVYRRWTGAGFDYSEATCPYAGAQSYDLDGNPVPNSMDKPSKRLGTCCRVRFGVNAALPFGGFPGVARVRAR